MTMQELLEKYNLFHSSVISGGKVKFNINFLPEGKVYISLVCLLNDEENKFTLDTINNDDFMNVYLPKIIQSFISKNIKVQIRKIMASNDQGTLIVQRDDLKDSLIIRNCSIQVIDLVELLYKCFSYISNERRDSSILFNEDYRQFDNYIKYNVLFDYATYRYNLFDVNEEKNAEELFLLNIARYAYTFENVTENDVWEEIKKNYQDNEKVIEVCDLFKNNNYSEDSIYSNILMLAEYEKNNDMLIQSYMNIVEEASKALEEGVVYFDDSYINYWINKQKEYEKSANEELQAICIDFVDAHDLYKKITFKTPSPVKKSNGKENVIISRLKKIRDDRNSFSQIINDPIKEEDIVDEEVEKIFSTIDNEQIKIDAEDQARRIIKLQEENRKLMKDADEYARIILNNQKDYKMIEESAKVQAMRIIELEKQNEELKKLAEENAKHIFERDRSFQSEAELRKEVDNTPVKSQDVDKINNLLYAISSVKNLDYAVNHPTIMQELTVLEEKTITYLTTHKNIIHEEDVIVPIEKEEMIEKKPVIELLSMIRNAYTSCHTYEKDGRHTLINFNPVDEDTFRVSLYSIKDDSEDLLMDAFFEQYQLTENVLQELCNIYKDGAVIVASKIDNIPPDKADYLVIDNMDNAIRFMDCNRAIIDKVKEYL